MARQTLRGSVTGEVSSTQPPPAALVTGMAPTNVAQGRSEQVTLTGLRTAFAPGATQVTFGAGITVEPVEVLSPTSLRARIAVASNAAVGVRAVRVHPGGDEVPSVVAFRVDPGASAVRGRLVDSFTGQPLAGARVTLNGTQLFTETDADGNFVLEGAPPGDGVLVITSQNYEVVRADVAIVANQAVDLGDAIGVDALARPSTPPGSLPRAATVASVLDRGLGSKDGGLSQEDAEALVIDAYLSLPTRSVGVIDETGAQLNPRMTGSGILSLKPQLVQTVARRWREGHVRDLGEVIENTSSALSILFNKDSSIDDMIDLLQQEVDAAWENPSAPNSVLPILLFNEGTTLSQLPPILTAATSLNVVQEHLFMTAFLVQNFGVMNDAVDRLLEGAGLDPASFEQPVVAVSPDPAVGGEGLQPSLHALWSRIGVVLGNAVQVIGERVVRTAHAQTGDPPPVPPNQPADPDGFWGLTPGARAAAMAQTLGATLIPALIAAIFAGVGRGALRMGHGRRIRAGLARHAGDRGDGLCYRSRCRLRDQDVGDRHGAEHARRTDPRAARHRELHGREHRRLPEGRARLRALVVRHRSRTGRRGELPSVHPRHLRGRGSRRARHQPGVPGVRIPPVELSDARSDRHQRGHLRLGHELARSR